MAKICTQCGKEIPEGVMFCTECGAKAPEAAPQPTPQPQQETAPQETKQNDYAAKLQELNNTSDTTADFDPEDVEKNKLMGILAYISWLVLIPLFGAKNSKFARFHVNQGLVLAITEIIWGVVVRILRKILFAISFSLGSLASTILGLVSIVFLIVSIIGIINAANGKAKELPVIGKFRILK